jgi:hypothetical protein
MHGTPPLRCMAIATVCVNQHSAKLVHIDDERPVCAKDASGWRPGHIADLIAHILPSSIPVFCLHASHTTRDLVDGDVRGTSFLQKGNNFIDVNVRALIGDVPEDV